MFEIELTPRLREGLNELRGGVEGVERIDAILDVGRVSCRDLYEYMASPRWPSHASAEMVRGVKFVSDRSPPLPRSGYTQEFRQELDRLRAQMDELEYQEIVKQRKLNMAVMNDAEDEELSPSQMNKQIKEQITTVFNILISVVSVVVAIWYWSRNSHILEVHHRVLLCLFFAILVLVAEVVVYSSYLRKIDEARKTERSKKERKRVVKKIVIN